MVYLRTLGALSLTGADGEEISSVLSQPKRLALLVYLGLSHPGSFQRRETLLALFWPERDESRARNALSQSLSHLRRNLPGNVIVSRGAEEVGLEPGSISIDVLEFQTALREGRWAEALDIYRGAFLQGFHVAETWGFEDWMAGERERLREAAAGAAWSLARDQIQRGALVEAERTAQRAMDLVYTDESPVRGFIEALARAGDRTAALNFYDRFSGRLRERLDLEPSIQTVEMAEAIRNGDVGPASAAVVGNGPPGGGTSGRALSLAAGDLPSIEGRHSGRIRPFEPGPTRKGRRTFRGALALLGVSGAAAAGWWLMPEPEPTQSQDRIAVAPFTNRTGDPALDPVAARLTVNLGGMLSRAGIGEVVPHPVVELALAGAGPDVDPLRVLPRASGAGVIVTGDLFLRGDSLLITAHCREGRTREEIYAVEPAVGPRNQEPQLTQQIQGRVSAALAQHLDTAFVMEAGVMPPPRTLEAYQEFRRGYEVYKLGGSHQDALGHFQRAWELDPSYLAAPLRVLALSATRFQLRPQADSILGFLEASRHRMTRYQRHYYDAIRLSMEGQQELAYREYLAMAEISPLHAASGLTEMGLMTNHIQKAIEAAGWLEKGNGEFHEPFVAYWQGYWSMYNHALHLGGRYQKELEIVSEWKERFPAEAYGPLQWEAYAKVGLGRLDELDARVADWRAEGISRLQAIWDLADELWVHGHRDEARALLEGEVQRFETEPAYIGRFNNQAMVLHRLGRDQGAHERWEAGVNLDRPDPWPWGVARIGFSAALTGDSAQAREMERLLMSLPEPQEPYTLFLQAKIAAALGEKDRAVRILTEWARRGTVLFWLNNLHRDFTFQSLLGDYPPFQELMRAKG